MTKPLTPADCDLRAFAFMPLDVVRLRDSDIAALSNGEEFRAAVLLWCASWHQIPAASLPDDDMILAQLAGFGRVVREWKKVRSGSLRGWILCSDGRLYHPVIAEKAIDAWNRKLEQAWKTECARIKKHNQRHEENQLTMPTLEEYLSQGTKKVCPKGQGENVPDLSTGKRDPIDIDRDIDREISKYTPENTRHAFPVKREEGAPSPEGLSCKAMIDAGIDPGSVNPSHPKLRALIDAGASPEEFESAAREAVGKGNKKFSYVLGIVGGRREDASKLKLHPGGKIPPADDFQNRDYGEGGLL